MLVIENNRLNRLFLYAQNSVRIKMKPQQMSTTKTKNEAYVSSALQTRPNEICTTSSPTSTAPGFEMAVKMPLINDTEVHHVAVNTNGTTERLKVRSSCPKRFSFKSLLALIDE